MRIVPTLIALILAACGGGATGTPATASPEGTPIGEIQGSGPASPLSGTSVVFSGIVTGDFQNGDRDGHGDLGGFYLQQVPGDGDPETSDGIFVFDGPNPTVDVNPGDRVTVRGVVKEHFGETQLAASSVVVDGSGLIRPVEVTLPSAATVTNSDGIAVADLERFEGMLVRFPQTLTVTALHELERFGSVQLAAGGRLYQFTNGNAPDAAAYASYRETTGSRTVQLDDGRRAEDVSPVRYLDSADRSLRAGDRVTGVTGNLRYSRGSGPSGAEGWRLMPTVEPAFETGNPRPAAPDPGGSLRVASFNVLNFFTTLDSGQSVCGPAGDDGCRGADSQREFERQIAKTVTALRMMDADIVGLVELENNPSASLETLVEDLNDATGTDAYAWLDTGTIGDDVIKTGFIYRPAAVTPLGSFAVLDRSVDRRFRDDKNRPALAQTFRQNSNGALLTIAVNHLKSKGSDCDELGDPNTADGQGNCAATRTAAAKAIVDWLNNDPTDSGDDDFLVIGDFNAYLAEDALRPFTQADYVNLVEATSGATAYSFAWDGQAGALDHALASPGLAPQVVGTIEWHINADEPPALDYNLRDSRDPALFDPDSPYRASDHDPVIVGLDLAP
jgi:predicted extracellular nuclease